MSFTIQQQPMVPQYQFHGQNGYQTPAAPFYHQPQYRPYANDMHRHYAQPRMYDQNAEQFRMNYQAAQQHQATYNYPQNQAIMMANDGKIPTEHYRMEQQMHPSYLQPIPPPGLPQGPPQMNPNYYYPQQPATVADARMDAYQQQQMQMGYPQQQQFYGVQLNAIAANTSNSGSKKSKK